ncbi:hypothetical protein Tco_1121639, partial [Tanacetum coccineum]
PCAMDLPREEHDKFQTIRTGEDVLIFPNAEGQDEPLIRAKRDSSDPMEDLKILWYGLEKERANLIAAQHAKWLPLDQDDEPMSSYTEYQSCSTSMEDLHYGDVYEGENYKGKCFIIIVRMGDRKAKARAHMFYTVSEAQRPVIRTITSSRSLDQNDMVLDHVKLT